MRRQEFPDKRSLVFFHEKTLGSLEVRGCQEIIVDLNAPLVLSILESLPDLDRAPGKIIYKKVSAFANPEFKRHRRRLKSLTNRTYPYAFVSHRLRILGFSLGCAVNHDGASSIVGGSLARCH
jgi:hypothetical protein